MSLALVSSFKDDECNQEWHQKATAVTKILGGSGPSVMKRTICCLDTHTFSVELEWLSVGMPEKVLVLEKQLGPQDESYKWTYRREKFAS